MPSKATLIEQASEAAIVGDWERYQTISDQLIKRIQYPEQIGVVPIGDLDHLSTEALLRMLVSSSELVGEGGLRLEAKQIARENQEKLLQTIKGRYNDLRSKLQQINEISECGSNQTNQDGC